MEPGAVSESPVAHSKREGEHEWNEEPDDPAGEVSPDGLSGLRCHRRRPERLVDQAAETT